MNLIMKKTQKKRYDQAPFVLSNLVTRVLVLFLHNRSMKMINNKRNKTKNLSKTIHVFETNKKVMSKLMTPIYQNLIYKGVYGVLNEN